MAGLVGLLIFALILLFHRKAIGFFLLLAPFNYFYVIAFGWNVSWVESGGVSEGAPAFIKYAKDVFFLMIVLSGLIHVLLRRNKWARSGQLLDWLVSSFLIFQAAMTIPAAFRIGPAPALTALWQNCGYGLVYYMLRPILSDCDLLKLRRFIMGLILVGGVVAGIGIAQFFSGINTFQYVSGEYQGLNRAISTLGNPSNLGVYLSFLLMAILTVGVHFNRFLQVIVFCMMALCLFLTVSMTALVMTTVGIILIFILERKWSILILTALLGAVALCSISLVPVIQTRLAAAISGQDMAWLLRLANWQALWPTESGDLFFGTGGGTGGAMTVSFFDQGGLADNQYLATVIQYGIIGLGLYLGILLAGSLSILRVAGRRKESFSGTLRMAGGLIVIGVALFGVSANVLNVFPINLYFWSALALITSVGNASRVRAVSPSPFMTHK
jgi:hypothetical protein